MSASSGVVTFLFTDIEGSTRRWEADADAMRSALQTHDTVLRECVDKYDGRVFKHTGDGVCAAFSSPGHAVDAAVAAQRVLELPVRMGLATGEAELREGDFFGAVVNRASRVMAAGHGGQILVDDVTASLLGAASLESLGPKRLRDTTNPVEIHQVRADGLRQDFPPLRSLDLTPGNLRSPTTTFVGRDAEVGDLEAALQVHHLVTLTGAGGVGKTRLALEVATRITDRFSDGVWVVELAPVGDPDAVPEVVAAALGITPQVGMSLPDAVGAAMEGRSRLLVFDNCEHVIDAAATMIEAILARSSTVSIVATSREGLRLPDERLWPVPPLDVTAGTESAAATLFTDRAQTVSPGVSLTGADETAAVVEICRRLDGIPLAIELAASRLLSMTATEVRDRLDDRFRLLVGSRRGLERHQTLRHAVEWSYDLLDDTEKSLLTVCSVFSGGFDLDGACAVSGNDDEINTLDVLDSLVRKSLLIADRSTSRTRYLALETIRQFSEDQLIATGNATRVRDVHARYFASRETDILALWDGPRQREAYDWFIIEMADLRSAFRWAAENGDIDTAAAIAYYAGFLGGCVEQLEPIAWAQEALTVAEKVQHRRLAQLYIVAVQCYLFDRIEDSLRYSEAGQLAVLSGRFDPDPVRIEATLGVCYIRTGEGPRWAAWCSTLRSLTGVHNVFTDSCRVHGLTIAGSVDEAVAESQSLLVEAEITVNPHTRIHAMLAYGFANADANPLIAYEVLQRALALAQDSGNIGIRTHLAVIISRLAARHGDPADALDYFDLAIRNFFDSGSFSLMPSPLAILAAFLDRLGHNEAGAVISRFAFNPLTKSAFPEFPAAVDHLREVLGIDTYEALAARGAAMTNAEMAKYAFEQIGRARAELGAQQT